MTIPTITGLRADMTPHRLWGTKKWFYATPLWYYHRPRTNDEIVPNRRFYELVDPGLRGLCRLLFDQGLATTPSCQGHHYPKKRFEEIWHELSDQQRQISNGGLVVKDSETDHSFLFRDRNYRMPWRSFRAFYEEAAAQQGVGYLGILIPPDREELLDRFECVATNGLRVQMGFNEPVGRQVGSGLFDIIVRSRTADEGARWWREITHMIERQLARRDCVAPLWSRFQEPLQEGYAYG